MMTSAVWSSPKAAARHESADAAFGIFTVVSGISNVTVIFKAVAR